MSRGAPHGLANLSPRVLDAGRGLAFQRPWDAFYEPFEKRSAHLGGPFICADPLLTHISIPPQDHEISRIIRYTYRLDLQLAFYDAIPASDGTSLTAPSSAEFKVFEVYDTARANPLPLRTVAGTNAAPLVTTAQGVVPPVEVVSPNFEHIFKSGEWEWRRESSEGIKRAALGAQAAAEEAVALVKMPTDQAVEAGIDRADIPQTVAAVLSANPAVVSSAATLAQSSEGLIPKWRPGALYAPGVMVVSPAGDMVIAKTAHTSTATYAPSNWNPTQAGALLASAVTKQGVLADGTDIDTLRKPGVYTIGTTASAGTMRNLPFRVAGEVWVGKNDASPLATQRAVGRASTGLPDLWTRTALSNSTWDAWKSDREYQGILADGTNIDAIRAPGSYIIATATSAATMTGLPTMDGAQVNQTAVLHVLTASNSSVGEQRILIYEADGVYKRFSRITRSASSWPAWEDDAPTPPPTEVPYPEPASLLPNAGTRHAMLQQMAYMRRGALGVQGKAVVSIRFDHWLNDMLAKVLPLMRKYMMPGSICLNADNMDLAQNLGTTWAQVADMALYDGIEIWNHAADHVGHTDEAGIVDTIVGGQKRLQEAVGPKLVVDGFMGNGSSYYDGYNLGRGIAAFTDTLAGRAIMNSHAFSDGKNSGFYQPLDGKIKLGASHVSVEASGSAGAIGYIEETKKHGRGITIYLHPGLIDQPSGFVLSDFEALLAYLSTERDAGRIEILTVSGMGVADATHTRREDLLTNTQFVDGFQGWSGSAGYNLRSVGGKQLASLSATAGKLTQNIGLYTRFGWAMGGVCELLVPARATGGVESVLRLQVHDTTDETVFKKERLFTLPADGSTVGCRIFVTPPADISTTSIRVTLGRESGGALEFMDEPHFRPV